MYVFTVNSEITWWRSRAGALQCNNGRAANLRRRVMAERPGRFRIEQAHWIEQILLLKGIKLSSESPVDILSYERPMLRLERERSSVFL